MALLKFIHLLYRLVEDLLCDRDCTCVSHLVGKETGAPPPPTPKARGLFQSLAEVLDISHPVFTGRPLASDSLKNLL